MSSGYKRSISGFEIYGIKLKHINVGNKLKHINFGNKIKHINFGNKLKHFFDLGLTRALINLSPDRVFVGNDFYAWL